MYIFLAFALLASQTLDYDMSRQQQKDTGVYKLTTKQKKALQDWIDANYAKRDTPLEIASNEKNAVISENLYNGRYIRLSDQSTWEINPDDTPLTQGWITPVEIVVSQSGDPQYPYKLTNSLTGSSVKAQKVSKLPKASAK